MISPRIYIFIHVTNTSPKVASVRRVFLVVIQWNKRIFSSVSDIVFYLEAPCVDNVVKEI